MKIRSIEQQWKNAEAKLAAIPALLDAAGSCLASRREWVAKDLSIVDACSKSQHPQAPYKAHDAMLDAFAHATGMLQFDPRGNEHQLPAYVSCRACHRRILRGAFEVEDAIRVHTEGVIPTQAAN